jgi:hypothetical protein
MKLSIAFDGGGWMATVGTVVVVKSQDLQVIQQVEGQCTPNG